MRRRLIAIFLLSVAVAASADAGDLQARIDAAAPGDTILLSPGIYAGGITINKPLRLVGKDYPVIDGNGCGDVIIIRSPDCEVRGLVIKRSGDSLDFENAGVRVLANRATIENNRFDDVLFGIDLKNASDCRVAGNHITSKALDIARRGDALRLFRSNNCLIERNVVENGRDVLLWYSNKVTVRGNVSRHNRYGFHMMYANDVTLEDNRLEGNSVGIYLMYGKGFGLRRNLLLNNRGPSGYGLGMKEVDAFAVEDNVFAGNRVGVYLDGSPYTRKPGSAAFTGNTFACNDIGMTLLPAVRGNRITGNNFIDNIEQIAVQGRGAIDGNDFAVAGRGNFWADYGGYDADHDGIGDQPYRARKLFESLIDREPKLRLMLFSPAHDAIEFIGRAMPAVQPEAKFADPSPLMHPVPMQVAASSADGDGLLLSSSILLLIASGIVIAAFGLPIRSRLRNRSLVPQLAGGPA